MLVSELIKKLEKLPQDMEVVYDYDGGYSTLSIDKVTIEHEYYDTDRNKVAVIY